MELDEDAVEPGSESVVRIARSRAQTRAEEWGLKAVVLVVEAMLIV